MIMVRNLKQKKEAFVNSKEIQIINGKPIKPTIQVSVKRCNTICKKGILLLYCVNQFI